MMNDVIISNNDNDIHMYLSSLTEDEAVKVASDCVVNGLLNCNRSTAADVQKGYHTTIMKFPSVTGRRMILEEEYNALYFVDRVMVG